MANARDEHDGELLFKHGGYRRLKTFQLAQLIYDVTVRFCDRYIDRRSRTHDQMVQAARSGVQNIAEGSMAGGTSRKTEIRLTNVAKASLEELRLDYEDFLRQRGLDEWSRDDPRRRQLTQQRCRTADEVAEWVVHAARRAPGERPLLSAGVPETSANAVLVLIGVTTTLLRRQLATQTKAFQAEGGFTERLYRTRHERREGNP